MSPDDHRLLEICSPLPCEATEPPEGVSKGGKERNYTCPGLDNVRHQRYCLSPTARRERRGENHFLKTENARYRNISRDGGEKSQSENARRALRATAKSLARGGSKMHSEETGKHRLPQHLSEGGVAKMHR